MGKIDLPPGWVHQAYRFEVDRPARSPGIASHEGAKRYAWNWGLRLVEEQLHARDAYRVLALRSGASIPQAEEWAKVMVPVPWSQAQLRKLWNDQKDLVTARSDEERVAASEHIHARQVYEVLAIRQGATAPEARNFADRSVPGVGWWSENSKEAYSSAFEALAQAFKSHFESISGKRKGPRVGWPRHKGRGGRQAVSFTTGAVKLLDRHHVQLPVVGGLRVKEPTDKLRTRLQAGTARILRASLVSEGSRTYVSFAGITQRCTPAGAPQGVCGHDVGISALVTSSDHQVVENPRAEQQVRKPISRYQRRMDRQHRTGSPNCFNEDGTHKSGGCHWNTRSQRAKETQRRLADAHARARNVRRDALHKASRRAAATYAVNVVEDLNVAGMGSRGPGQRGFNRAAKDAALAEYRRQLSYKCPWYGSALWLAARWYPSSKMCSACRVKKAKLSRSERVFHCDACGLTLDRDLNAAKNLAALTELAGVGPMAQMVTGQPVDWSKLPIRPYGWGPDQDTRSSRGCARAEGRKAQGGGRKTARRSSAGDRPFDREAAVATGPVVNSGGISPSPKKAVA
ncbi:MAG: RNA-guided endonuclease TnpB family protein [Candidatus Dormibacteria bacterium]